jgi:hypothetical protein
MANPQPKAGLFGGKRAAQLREAAQKAGAVWDAAVGVRTSDRPETGPVSYREIDGRIARVRQDLRAQRWGAVAAGLPPNVGDVLPGAATAWVNRVLPGHSWDDRAKRGDEYERQGNFGYGATAAALRIPEEIAVLGGGVAQRWLAVRDALKGTASDKLRERGSWFGPSRGDDPRDTMAIRDGYSYGLERRGAR